MTCKDYAAKLLSFCDRSEKEIREKILKKGYSEAECEEAIAFCRSYGYLDDSRYVQHFVNDAVNLKKHGKARIKQELRQKGIDDSLIEEALASINDEREMLISEMERRFKGCDFTDKKVKNKVFGFFLRRGFSARDILCAMNAEEDYE